MVGSIAVLASVESSRTRETIVAGAQSTFEHHISELIFKSNSYVRIFLQQCMVALIKQLGQLLPFFPPG